MISVEQIHHIIKRVSPTVDVEKIDPNTRLREYGVDSMDFFSIILELQDVLGEEIPDSDIDQLRTVADIQDYFKRKKA